MSYSKKYRERTIEYRQAGHSIQDALRRHKNLFSIYLTFLECAIIVEEEGAERDEKKLSERHQPGTI